MSNSLDFQQIHDSQTYKSSDGMGGNPFLEFFGPPNHPVGTNAFEKLSHEIYDLPEAYKGRNTFLNEKLTGFIMNGDNWETRVCLPYKKTDQLNFTWNEIRFDKHLAGRVPEQGVSRLIRSQKTSYSEKSVRWGLMMMLEHGFMNTEEGRRQYTLNIRQIKDAVQRTLNADVLAAVLQGRRHDIQYQKEHGLENLNRFGEIRRREVTNWAAVQKDVNSFKILHEDCKQRLLRNQAAPNMWIFPPMMCTHITMVQPNQTEYWKAGERGPKMLEAGPSALGSFRGVNVYETSSFDETEGDIPIDMLAKNVQIGEYYVMKESSNMEASTYKTKHRNIKVFDEDVDKMVELKIEDAIENCFRFTEDDTEGSLHEDHVQLFDGKQEKVQDIFAYRRGNTTYVANVFGQMEKEYLKMNTCRDITLTALKDFPKEKLDSLNKLQPKDVAKSPLFKDLYNYLRLRFPHSLFFTKDRENEMDIFYQNVTGSKGLFVQEDLSLGQLSTVFMGAKVDFKLCKAAVKKYDDEEHSENFAHGVLEMCNNTDMHTPEFKSLNKMFKDIKGHPDTDAPVLAKMGITINPNRKRKTYVCDNTPSEYTLENTPFMAKLKASGCRSNSNDIPNKRVSTSSGWRPNNTIDNILSENIGSMAYPVSSSNPHQWPETKAPFTEEAYAFTSKQLNDRLSAAHHNSFVHSVTEKVFLMSKINKISFQRMCDYNIVLPCNFIIARCWMEYRTYAAVMMKGGTETGNTFVGHTDFTVGDDIRSKIHECNYTFYGKAIVHEPKNIIINENVFVRGYLGGDNTEFFKEREIENFKHNRVIEGRRRPSLIAMMIPYEETKFKYSPIDIRGSYGQPGDSNDDLHYSTARYYQNRLGFDNINSTMPGELPFLSENIEPNTSMYQGHQMNWGGAKFDDVTLNTGHWGPNVYPGCGKVRAGESSHLKDVSTIYNT